MMIKISLLRGLLVLMPLGIISYLVFTIWTKIDSIGRWPILKIMGIFGSDAEKFIIPGAGIALLAIICYAIGRLSLKEGNFINRVLEKLPIIKIFFGKNDEILNSTPCQVWRTPTLKSEAFIIGAQKTEGKDEEDLIIYFANPPLLITGEISNVPRHFVIKLANSPKEILNKLLFFGKVKPEKLIPVPWDGETAEEFKERLNSSPLQIELRRIFRKGQL